MQRPVGGPAGEDSRFFLPSGDRRAPRQTLAFSLSVALHLTMAVLLFVLAAEEPPPPPIEISIFETGDRGAASPPPGEKSAEPGPIGPPVEQAAPPVPPAPKAVAQPKIKAATKPVVKPQPAPRPVESVGLLAALRSKAPVATTQVFDGVESSVKLRSRPNDSAATTGSSLGAARASADVQVGSDVVASSGPAVTGSLGAGVGTVRLPGAGGDGSGWGGGGAGAGGGGTGRGGFSVSGAGSGGSGRSYASIWNWTQRYLAGLRWAYNNELRTDPSLRGVVVVRYEILPAGDVGAVSLISSGLKSAHLEQEVLRQIRTWRYPPEPSGAVVVTWPFSFVPPS